MLTISMHRIYTFLIVLLFACSDSDPAPTIENTFLDKVWITTMIDGQETDCLFFGNEESWKFRSDGVYSFESTCFTDRRAGFWDYDDNGNLRPLDLGGIYFIFLELNRDKVTIEIYNIVDDLLETRSFKRG